MSKRVVIVAAAILAWGGCRVVESRRRDLKPQGGVVIRDDSDSPLPAGVSSLGTAKTIVFEADGYELEWTRGGFLRLFHSEIDPARTRDLVRSEPDRAASMARRMLDSLEPGRASGRNVDGSSQEETAVEGLRRMGYIVR